VAEVTETIRSPGVKRAFILSIFVLAFSSFTVAQNQSPPKQKVVTAAQTNGAYRYYDNEFRILALGHNKLKVQFDGIYHTLAKSVNIGSASGEATIEGNVATFIPEGTQGCKITITFRPGKIVVEQDGDDAT